MRVISFRILRDFIVKHPEASTPVLDWFSKTKAADWTSPIDIKEMFGSTDYVGNKRYVFNIGGNNYRLVAMIFFEVKQVYIRFIGTHKECDGVDVKNV